MDEKIKDKVREIQHKYCGLSVEYKLYKAIEETIKETKRRPSISLKLNLADFREFDS